MNKDNAQRFIEKSKAALDQAQAELDPEVRNKLYQARVQALSGQPLITEKPVWRAFISKPLLPLAMAMSLVLGVIFLPNNSGENNSHPNIEILTQETLELLSSEEELELYEELEFMVWLSTQPAQG